MYLKEKYGYVYKITNCINGKIYVGIHKYRGPGIDTRYWAGGILITEALKKYGKSNFYREIIEWCYSKEELNTKEEYWIKELDARNLDVGYNLAVGGFHNGGNQFGHPTSEQTRIKISQANKGRKRTLEWSHNSSISHTGLTQSQETIDKRVSKTRGKKRTLEQRKNLSDGCKHRVYKNICTVCKQEFITRSNATKTCPECMIKKIISRQEHRVYNRIYKVICTNCGCEFNAGTWRKKLCDTCEIKYWNDKQIVNCKE